MKAARRLLIAQSIPHAEVNKYVKSLIDKFEEVTGIRWTQNYGTVIRGPKGKAAETLEAVGYKPINMGVKLVPAADNHIWVYDGNRAPCMIDRFGQVVLGGFSLPDWKRFLAYIKAPLHRTAIYFDGGQSRVVIDGYQNHDMETLIGGKLKSMHWQRTSTEVRARSKAQNFEFVFDNDGGKRFAWRLTVSDLE